MCVWVDCCVCVVYKICVNGWARVLDVSVCVCMCGLGWGRGLCSISECMDGWLRMYCV